MTGPADDDRMTMPRRLWRAGELLAGAVGLLVAAVIALCLVSIPVSFAAGLVYGAVEQIGGNADDDRETDRPRRSFCERHRCVADFYSGQGDIVRCGDGVYSHSGGRQGACSNHGGVAGSGDGGYYYGGNGYGGTY